MSLGSSYTFDPADDKSRSRRRRIAEQLMAQGMETSPIQSPWQGAARMAQALMGGIELGMEDKKEREQTAAYNAHNSSIMPSILGGGEQAQPKLSMSPVTQAMMPPEQVKAIIDANVPEADREFAYRMAQKESAFDPNAVSPTGAKGLFQFTRGTWGDVTGQSVGRASDGRADPVANTKAFVELTRRNREALRGVLGRDPTPGELAVAHQQGVGGATALLTGKGTVDPRNLAVQAGNPKNAQDIMRYYGFAPDQGQGGPIQVAQAGGQTMNDGNARVQQLYGIATNPMTSPVNKKLALDEIERLRKGADPAAALELQIKQEQLRKLREKPTVDPLEQRQKELAIKKAERDLEGSGKAPEVRVIKQPDGSEVAVQWDAKANDWKPLAAPEGGNAVRSNKPLTEAQAKDANFYYRTGTEVLDRMDKQDKALDSYRGKYGGKIPVVGNLIKPDAYRQAEQTGRELLAVILRKDTGAAVTKEEVELYGDMYLPVPNDDDVTIRQKRDGRRAAVEGIKLGLPAATILQIQREKLETLKEKGATGQPQATQPAQKVRRYNPQTGKFEEVSQ